MVRKQTAHTLLAVICAFSVIASPAIAQTVVYDEEAERAELSGMERDEAQSITHVIAEEKYEGSVNFMFRVPENGTYLIEAKTLAPDKRHDSFEVSLNDSSQFTWHVPRSDTWQWNPVAFTDEKSGIVELESGNHALTFFGREKTRLDRVKVTLLETENERELSTETDTGAVVEVANAYYVDRADGSDDNEGTKTEPFETIQRGLEAAEAGEVIYVAPGTYTEEIVTVRSGSADAPIVLTAADQDNPPVLDLEWDKNGPVIEHSHITLSHFEIKDFDEGVRIEGATGVTLAHNRIHHGENECVRVRYGAKQNLITENTIHFCGAKSPRSRIDGGNGEGIYIGTAPEQREKYDGGPDQSTGNQIIANHIYDVTEGIDLKEDSHHTVVKRNKVRDTSDENSGAINVRGDDNVVENNIVYRNQGAGLRFGGDGDVVAPGGSRHDYGVNNLVVENTIYDNEGYGLKIMRDGQQIECQARLQDNEKGDINVGSVRECS